VAIKEGSATSQTGSSICPGIPRTLGPIVVEDRGIRSIAQVCEGFISLWRIQSNSSCPICFKERPGPERIIRLGRWLVGGSCASCVWMSALLSRLLFWAQFIAFQALNLLTLNLVNNAQMTQSSCRAILCARSRIVKRRVSGDFDDLRQVMSVIGIGGKWRKRENHHQYRAATGAVLNWWKSTGTIMFQGGRPAAKDLEAALM
jgi:hypothetical protein